MSFSPVVPVASAAALTAWLPSLRGLTRNTLAVFLAFWCAGSGLPLAAQTSLDPGLPGSPASPGTPLPLQIPQMAGGVPAEEMRDIVPPVEVPFWTGPKVALAVALGLLLLAGLLVAAVRWSRRARPAPPPPDPRQVALRALFGLRSAADGDMEARDFAAAVAEVLRHFLEARYAVAAPKQTTEEFLVSAQTSGKFPPAEIARLRSFLTQCDLLKFAKGSATTAAKQELLNLAESQVKEAAA